jgi:hypothetical protein
VCYPDPIAFDGRVVVTMDDEGRVRIFDQHGEELLTLSAAADLLGLKLTTIHTLVYEPRESSAGKTVRRPRLKALRLDDRTILVRRSEVERYQVESKGRPGRKKGRLQAQRAQDASPATEPAPTEKEENP